DIYVDGDYIGVGSCTVERTIGTHTISYGDMKGYEKPSSKSIEVMFQMKVGHLICEANHM
ncbi:MAG: hypothetical protein U9N61_10700, partial [Euryarchaeota archaeon]|nr:hypothetical protein [Euryarchaeota archaeon]